MNFLSTLHYHIRYNHALIYFTTIAAAVILLAVNVVYMTAATGLLDAIGATEVGNRVVAAKETVFWSYRAWIHRDANAELIPERKYGYLQSANRDGSINVQIIAGSDYQTIRVLLADLQITNINGLAAIVELNKKVPVDIDLYRPLADKTTTDLPELPQAVIWLENKPFNIAIITASVAIPAKNPPTNIVDQAFAEYNKKIALNRR